jgi:predicted DNA-binding transcriptional regulator AlpA
MSQKVIRISDLASTKISRGLLPVSPATIWRWVRQGKFPEPFKLGHSITVWDVKAIDTFIAQRAERTDQWSK